jgi:hypothetical protein
MSKDLLVERYENDNIAVEVHYDTVEESPRDPAYNDTFGTMVGWHDRYNLSDEDADYRGKREFLESMSSQYYLRTEILERAADYVLLDHIRKEHIILPVYMHEHGGVKLGTNVDKFTDKWDSGWVGWIFVSKEDAKREFGVSKLGKLSFRKAEDLLRSEVETYSNYLNGDVFRVSILEKREDGEEVELDSCGGFYGWDNYQNGAMDYVRESGHEEAYAVFKGYKVF